MAAGTYFTQAQADSIQHAVNLMVQGSAVELPFDSTCMELVAKVAAAKGVSASDGTFLQDCKNRPISTLLSWLLTVGGAPGGVVPTET